MDASSKEKQTQIFVRPRSCKYSAADLPVIQNLLGLGYDVDQVGKIMAYSGKDWQMAAIKKLGDDARQAIDNGLQMADVQMIQQLEKTAWGYNYTEVHENYDVIEKFNPDTNEVETKLIKTGEKRIKKHQPGNNRLAELLVTNRLPDIYKKVSELKKTELNANISGELSEAQIDRLVGRLLTAVKETKVIDAEVVETDVEVR